MNFSSFGFRALELSVGKTQICNLCDSFSFSLGLFRSGLLATAQLKPVVGFITSV